VSPELPPVWPPERISVSGIGLDIGKIPGEHSTNFILEVPEMFL